MRLPRFVSDTLVRIWPPYELRYGKAQEDAQPVTPKEEDRPDRTTRTQTSREIQEIQLAAAEAVYKAEQERKKVIEDKASSFFAGATLSSTIVIALPTILVGKIAIGLAAQLLLLMLFSLAVIYLLSAAYYATTARAVRGLHALNAGLLDAMVLSDLNLRQKWARTLIEIAQQNEPILRDKSNHLYVAERLFLRGIIITILTGLLLGATTVISPVTDNKEVFAYKTLASCLEVKESLHGELLGQTKLIADLRADLAASKKEELTLRARIQARAVKKVEPSVQCCQSPTAMPKCESPNKPEQ